MTQDRKIVWSIAGILKNSQGFILIQQRPKTSRYGGLLWELPGGKIEPKETPEEAVVREMLEELGIHVDIEHIIPFSFASQTFDWGHMVTLCFQTSTWTGTPQICDDQADLRWISPNELPSLSFAQSDLPFISHPNLGTLLKSSHESQ